MTEDGQISSSDFPEIHPEPRLSPADIEAIVMSDSRSFYEVSRKRVYPIVGVHGDPTLQVAIIPIRYVEGISEGLADGGALAYGLQAWTSLGWTNMLKINPHYITEAELRAMLDKAFEELDNA